MLGPERVVGPRKSIAESAALNAGGCDSSGGFCRVDPSVHAGGAEPEKARRTGRCSAQV